MANILKMFQLLVILFSFIAVNCECPMEDVYHTWQPGRRLARNQAGRREELLDWSVGGAGVFAVKRCRQKYQHYGCPTENEQEYVYNPEGSPRRYLGDFSSTSIAVGGDSLLLYNYEDHYLYRTSLTNPSEDKYRLYECVSVFDISDKGHIWFSHNTDDPGCPRQDSRKIRRVDSIHQSSDFGQPFTSQNVSQDYRARQLSVGESGVWMVSTDYDVYYRNGTYGDEDTNGNGWIYVPFKMKMVVSGRDIVVGLSLEGNRIWYRAGVSADLPFGGVWVETLARFDQTRRYDGGTPSHEDITKIGVSGSLLYVVTDNGVYGKRLWTTTTEDVKVKADCWDWRSAAYNGVQEISRSIPDWRGCRTEHYRKVAEQAYLEPSHVSYNPRSRPHPSGICTSFLPYPLDILVGKRFPPALPQEDDDDSGNFDVNLQSEYYTLSVNSYISTDVRVDTRHLGTISHQG